MFKTPAFLFFVSSIGEGALCSRNGAKVRGVAVKMNFNSEPFSSVWGRGGSRKMSKLTFKASIEDMLKSFVCGDVSALGLNASSKFAEEGEKWLNSSFLSSSIGGGGISVLTTENSSCKASLKFCSSIGTRACCCSCWFSSGSHSLVQSSQGSLLLKIHQRGNRTPRNPP